MHPDFWLERWRNGETGWHAPSFNAHLTEFWPQLRVPASATVLVPLCGRSLDLLWLAGCGHRVIGIELSEIAVRDFFSSQNLTPQITGQASLRRYQFGELVILCGDFFDVRPDHLPEISGVFDRAALIALPPEMRVRYVAHLHRLAPLARSLLITLVYDQERKPGPPFAVHEGEVEELFAGCGRPSLLSTHDLSGSAPQFRSRGITEVCEQIWRIDPSD